jgi:hypothetical protein
MCIQPVRAIKTGVIGRTAKPRFGVEQQRWFAS